MVSTSSLIFYLVACGPKDDPGADTGDSLDSGAYLADGLQFSAVQSCTDPLPEVRYTEVAEAMGLEGTLHPNSEYDEGGTVVAGDFDLDGDIDLAFGFMVYPPTLYWRIRDSYVRQELAAPSDSVQLSMADVEGDGDYDLLVGTWSPPSYVLLNEEGEFTPMPLPLPFPEFESELQQLSPGDINGDAIIDLYAVVNGPEGTPEEERSDYLLIGVGDGTFVADTSLLPVEKASSHGLDAVWVDWQSDGDLDLYVINEKQETLEPNVLYDVQNGALVDVSDECICGLVDDGMGGDAGDFNRDGIMDIYETATGINTLLQGAADGTYIDVTHSMGADPGMVGEEPMAWGSIWLDYDNDGFLDILFAQGQRSGFGWPEFDAPITLMRQVETGFEDVSTELGLDEAGVFRATLAFDDNGDGVLDLLVSDQKDPPRFYLSDGCTEAGWLEIHAPSGTRVEIQMEDYAQQMVPSTNSSYMGGSPSIAHFGLGVADVVQGITLDLPDGRHFDSGPFLGRRTIRID